MSEKIINLKDVALLSRLNEQRSQGLFCDITIVVEDVKFRAHRNILAAGSGYFRSAFTSLEAWTSSQVLELMDLRSEVFASILNFIYCSKATPLADTEETRCLVAAGKRLGIPFLEKLAEQERQGLGWPQNQTLTNPLTAMGYAKPQGPCKSNKEGSRPVEPDDARGPRITNEPMQLTVGSPALTKASVPPVLTPPSLWPQTDVHTGTANDLPLAADNGYTDLEPPPLSPHTEDSISVFGCEHCPEIFTKKALLTVHTEMHNKRFVSHLFCKFCCRKFMHLKRLRNHEAVLDFHSDKMPCIGNTVPDVQLLVKPGGGQRVYNCSVCKRAYVTLSSLKRHENVHSWQRAYPCHYCNKVFALAEYRTKHEIWHTGERRYQCIFCLETFMTYYILKNHQKAFHGIDPRLSVNKKSDKRLQAVSQEEEKKLLEAGRGERCGPGPGAACRGQCGHPQPPLQDRSLLCY
uniref:Zinc finger and BTB domain containing 38 n=1 Tax=Esox lucius TaxID=8010 RepID=A0A6Q2XZL1_ESOLU